VTKVTHFAKFDTYLCCFVFCINKQTQGNVFLRQFSQSRYQCYIIDIMDDVTVLSSVWLMSNSKSICQGFVNSSFANVYSSHLNIILLYTFKVTIYFILFSFCHSLLVLFAYYLKENPIFL